MAAIRNIIFDLGGVIINLDTPRTIAAFDALSSVAFESIYSQAQQTSLFDEFDKGGITEDHFFSTIKGLLKTSATTEQLEQAWNAMLLDFPKHRLELLLALKSKYRIFLLSNTNETHIREFEKILYKEHVHHNLDFFFHKTYYSCRIGMRKPDAEIFRHVLQQNNLEPSETLFIDDTQKHVDGAKSCGIRAHLLHAGTDVSVLLKELLD